MVSQYQFSCVDFLVSSWFLMCHLVCVVFRFSCYLILGLPYHILYLLHVFFIVFDILCIVLSNFLLYV